MRRNVLTLLFALLMIGFVSACQPAAEGPKVRGGADHEHGPDTHTHDEPIAADTAGTYVDSTAAFFEEADHEHGPDTHTHDDDATGHQ